MIIKKLYETNISINQYEAPLNTSLDVTVKLVDFNGENVTGTSVKLTVDKGYISRVVGETVSDYTNTTTKNVTMNTDANGEIKVTYHANTSGLVTFSANNTKVHCYITTTEISRIEVPITYNTSYFNTSASWIYITKVRNDFCFIEYGIKSSQNLPSSSSIYDTNGYVKIGEISDTSFIPPSVKYFDAMGITILNSNNATSPSRIKISSDGGVHLNIHSKGKGIAIYGSGIYSFTTTSRG